MKIRLLALDLDDTLLHRDLSISPGNIAAIRDAEAAGIKIVLASGRNHASLRSYADLLGLKRPGDFLICSNGAELVAADTGATVERLNLGAALCREASAAIEARGFTWEVYIGGKILCSEVNEWAMLDSKLSGQPVEAAGDREALFAEGPVKFVVPGDPERIERLLVELGSVFAGRAEVITSKPYFLEVLPLGADKGETLIRLAARLGIPMSSVMAVGDAMNDLGMIRAAGWGCAPANAIPSVLAAARVVSEKTNDEDAVADLVRKVALPRG